eukprot:TRINITY_DN4205_c0_g1_i1.p1 TRINITY_DN4205_c0_g1~~TRINITY_DN4205_c0_g1_i1.p1  ORF type:complete len:649 (+),score=139.62 TRINITY_DN4205_c0_g1_i1:134-2080(+)
MEGEEIVESEGVGGGNNTNHHHNNNNNNNNNNSNHSNQLEYSTIEKTFDYYSKRIKISIENEINNSNLEGGKDMESDQLSKVGSFCSSLFGKVEDSKVEYNPLLEKKELLITFACIEESQRAKTALVQLQQRTNRDSSLNSLAQFLSTNRIGIKVGFETLPSDESRICLAFENVPHEEHAHKELISVIREYAQPEGDIMYSHENEAAYVFFKNRIDASNIMLRLQGYNLQSREIHVKNAIPKTDSFLQTRHLWIGNIDERISDQMLNERFSPYGEIETIKIYKMKSHAFVDFTNVPSAVNARFFLDGSWIGNQKIIIRFGKQEFSRILKVNIHPNITLEDLKTLFGKYGQINDISTKRTDSPHALIEFQEEDEAKNALNDLQGALLNGVPVTIDYHFQGRMDSQPNKRGREESLDYKSRNAHPSKLIQTNSHSVNRDTRPTQREPTNHLNQNQSQNNSNQTTRAGSVVPNVIPQSNQPNYSPSAAGYHQQKQIPMNAVLRRDESLQDQLSKALLKGNQQESSTKTLAQFKEDIIERYKRCIISECDVLEGCEAAHIQPLAYFGTNETSNGILLRKDLHSLFDLHLVRLKPFPNSDKVEIELDPSISTSYYQSLNGKTITINDSTTRDYLSLKLKGPHIWLMLNQSRLP